MAITLTARLSAAYSGSAVQTITTPSFTPSANSTLYMTVYALGDFTTGELLDIVHTSNTGGLTFSRVVQSGFANARMALFEAAVGGSPSAMTVTFDVDSDGTQTAYPYIVAVDAVGSVGDVQIRSGQFITAVEVDGGGNTESHTSGTLPAVTVNGNTVVLVLGRNNDSNGAATTPSGWTQLFGNTTQFVSGSCWYRTDFADDGPVTITDLGQAISTSGTILFELEEASGGGPVEVAVDPAVLSLTGQTPAVAGTGAATTTADPATLVLTGQTSALAGSGAVPVPMDPAALLLAGQDSPLAGSGATTTAVDPAELALAGETPTAAGSGATTVTIDAATLTLATQTPAATGTGAAAVPADPAVLTLAGQTPDLAGTGAGQVAVDVAVLILTGVEVSGGGAILVAVEPAMLSLTGQTPTAAGTGATTLAVDVADLTIVGLTPDTTGTGQAAIVADTATLTLTGPTPSLAGEGVSPLAVDAAVLTLTGVEVIATGYIPDPNPVTLTIRETGHTATIRETGHTLTIRETGHTATTREQT